MSGEGVLAGTRGATSTELLLINVGEEVLKEGAALETGKAIAIHEIQHFLLRLSKVK